MLGLVAVSLFLLLFLVVRSAYMAKKKKSGMDMMFATSCAPKAPTKAQIIASEAKYLGQRIAEQDPKVKKMRDTISRAVEQAVRDALKKGKL